MISAFLNVYERKSDAQDWGKEASRQFARTARNLVAEKVNNKIASKLGAKIGGKVVGKAIFGFIPFVGPSVAAGINWWIISGISNDAQDYFDEKADIICR